METLNKDIPAFEINLDGVTLEMTNSLKQIADCLSKISDGKLKYVKIFRIINETKKAISINTINFQSIK